MLTAELLRHMAISQLFMLGISAFIFHRKTYIGKLLTFFAICMACYLVFPLLDLSQNKTASFLLGRLAFATPAVLWLIAYAFLVDKLKVPMAVWICIAAYMLLRAIGSIYFHVVPAHPRFSLEFALFYIVPASLGLFMCANMIFLALSGYDQDLIEERRKIRVPFVLILGGLFVLMGTNSAIGLAKQMSEGFPISSETLEWASVLCIFPVTLAVNVILFRLSFTNFQLTVPYEKYLSTRSTCENLDPRELEFKTRIISSMEQDKLFTKSGLTIGELANALNIQEYKLRHIINRHLHYKNFSNFLNGFRIKEAEKKLVNTNDSIFNIGLDVGYTSLSSFHKAFKESHGKTPKEFRVLNRGVNQ